VVLHPEELDADLRTYQDAYHYVADHDRLADLAGHGGSYERQQHYGAELEE
jgi:hypothetical protein